MGKRGLKQGAVLFPDFKQYKPKGPEYLALQKSRQRVDYYIYITTTKKPKPVLHMTTELGKYVPKNQGKHHYKCTNLPIQDEEKRE